MNTGTVSLDLYMRPGTPAAVTAVPGDGHAVLRWTTAPPNGAAIESWWYAVREANSNEEWRWRQAGAGAHVNRVRVNGLQNGTRYAITVRARNAAGDGDDSGAYARPGACATACPR